MYKRQVLETLCDLSAVRGEGPLFPDHFHQTCLSQPIEGGVGGGGRRLGQVAEILVPEGSFFKAVSYTHLDVYKRQG